MPLCAHRGRNGRCNQPLTPHHACTCPVGGGIVRRHNRASRYLCSWLNDGRSSCEALLEQRTIWPAGVMDITAGTGSQQVWIDVAIVSASSSSTRELAHRAKVDGAAARTEEQVKRQRYGARVVPFVVEAGGRPGPSARSVLSYAIDEPTVSIDVANAWQALSNVIQAETAISIINAWGGWRAIGSTCEIAM